MHEFCGTLVKRKQSHFTTESFFRGHPFIFSARQSVTQWFALQHVLLLC
jgi:hypothetical protein